MGIYTQPGKAVKNWFSRLSSLMLGCRKLDPRCGAQVHQFVSPQEATNSDGEGIFHWLKIGEPTNHERERKRYCNGRI